MEHRLLLGFDRRYALQGPLLVVLTLRRDLVYAGSLVGDLLFPLATVLAVNCGQDVLLRFFVEF